MKQQYTSAVKLHNEDITVMNLYVLNIIMSKQIFKNYKYKKQTDRKNIRSKKCRRLSLAIAMLNGQKINNIHVRKMY